MRRMLRISPHIEFEGREPLPVDSRSPPEGRISPLGFHALPDPRMTTLKLPEQYLLLQQSRYWRRMIPIIGIAFRGRYYDVQHE